MRARAAAPRGLGWVLVASLAVHAGALGADQIWWPNWRWQSLPVHSSLEMAGALIALAAAWMLVRLERRRAGSVHSVRLASGLAAMGIFDALHALTPEGTLCLWLKAAGMLSGAAIFATVGVPLGARRRGPGFWPLCSAAAAGLLGLYLATRSALPPLALAGEYTPLAHGINFASSALLGAAAVCLCLQERSRRSGDDRVFAFYAALFCSSALVFQIATAWDAAWWAWHALRILAYGAVLLFLAGAYTRLQESIASELRERAERATRLTERLLESAPVQIFVSDCRIKRMLYASAAGRVMLGLPPHQIQTHGRQTLEELIHPDDLPRLRKLAACEPGAPDVEDCELRIRGDGGSWQWLYHRKAVLDRDADGSTRQIVEISTNISGLKRAESALERVNVELARSNRDLEVYASVASHDLQTPIRNIATSVGFLQRDLLDLDIPERARRHLAALQTTSAYMQKLVDGLLTFARVGTRGARLDQPVSCELLFRQIAESLEGPLTEAGAQLSIGALADLCGDGQQLRQLFQNLIENALRYRDPARPPIIHVESEVKLDKVLFSVADNGIGIAPAFRETVFEMFKRLHHQDEYPGGTGIGLAFCRRVAERHGGRIWVSDRSDGAPGCVFWVELPLRPVEEKPW